MSEQRPQDDDLKAFLIVLHRALKGIVIYIERKYDIGDGKGKRAA